MLNDDGNAYETHYLNEQINRLEAELSRFKKLADVQPIVRLEYDDDLIAAVDKINKALSEHGLTLEDDMQEHDGFCIYTLKTKE